VHPPPGFASGNVPPTANDAEVPLGPDGSEQAGAQSQDNQLVLNLAPKAAAPHPPDTSVRIHMEPLDPAKLGPVPPGVLPNGNAYRVTFTYQPSGTPVPSLAATGNVLLVSPEPIAGLLYAPDGRAWQRISSQIVPGQSIVGGPFTNAGYYLAATHPAAAKKSGGGGNAGTIILVVLVAGIALALGLFPVVRRRIRTRRRPPPRKGGSKRRP
jgi:hypothetical protein